MKVRLVCLGKTTESYIREGLDVYLKRIKHYLDFSVFEIDEIKGSKKMSMDEYRRKEAEKLLPVLTAERIILLDEKGKSYTSFALARKLDQFMVQGLRSLDFVVGGPFGFDQAVRDLADESLSLSELTFSHQMVRMFFVEQIYRSMTIIRGESYHHS